MHFDPASHNYVRRSGTLLSLLFIWTLSSCHSTSAQTAASTQAMHASTSHDFEFTFRKGLILISAAPYRPGAYFVLDTGAGVSVLNTHVFSDVKTQPFRDVPQSPVRLVAPPPRISVYSMDISTLGYCAATDLSGLTDLVGTPVAGIIGWPGVDHRVLQLDFAKHSAKVFDSDQKSHADWGIARKIILKDGDWYSLFDINGQPTELLIDSGSHTFIDASKTVFKSLHSNPVAREDSDITITIQGPERRPRFFPKSLKVDGKEYVDRPIRGNGLSFSSVGTGYLQDFLVTLDFENKLLYLKPAPVAKTATISSTTTGATTQ